MDLNPVPERLEIEGFMKPMDLSCVEERSEKEGIDRISNLPNSVLLNVTSRLSWKEAGATSVLSSRWYDIAFYDNLSRRFGYPNYELRQSSKIMKTDCTIDRISDLPESILEKILSFLPTKNAVGATILSTRWKNLSPFWSPPVELQLVDTNRLHPRKNVESETSMNSFRAFVDKLLFITLRDVPRVETFYLDCEKNYGDADILSWVSAALGLHVQRLILSLDFPLDNPEALFNSLNWCKTLVNLRLEMECELSIPDNFSLPCLKVLHLSSLVFDDEDGGSINEMIDGCPVLEVLTIIYCTIRLSGRLSIISPLLQDLSIEHTWSESPYPYDALEVHAPNLETWIYRDYVAHGFILSTFKAPNAVHIEVGPSEEQLDDEEFDVDFFCTNVARLIVACSSTKWIYLAECSICAIDYSSVPLPQFPNLTWLSLGSVSSNKWMILASLLCNAPNLELLTFQEEFKPTVKGFADFDRSMPNPPSCLEHLKKIECQDFSGREDEIRLIQYFLRNGGVLENVTLCCLPSVGNRVSRRIRSFPKSEIVQLAFKLVG